jgi:glycyl-tRNA synthetase
MGLAYRTDYDLSGHARHSGEDLSVFLEEKQKKVVCHVVEPSYGIDRPFYCVLEHSYVREGKRKYLRLRKELAPIEIGVFPLLTRDGLPERAREVEGMLRARRFMTDYDEAGSIGRRYLRADEIGTPYCVTVDHRTLEDDTVTVRDRDTTKQVRVKIPELPRVLRALLSGEVSLEATGEPVEK